MADGHEHQRLHSFNDVSLSLAQALRITRESFIAGAFSPQGPGGRTEYSVLIPPRVAPDFAGPFLDWLAHLLSGVRVSPAARSGAEYSPRCEGSDCNRFELSRRWDRTKRSLVYDTHDGPRP